MKKRIGLIIVFGLLSSLGTFAPAQATRSDDFTFFVPYSANSLKAQFEAMQSVVNPGWEPQQIHTTISISVLGNGTTVYYDHWEDGLEDSATFPTQSTTEVYAGLSEHTVLTLESDVGVPLSDRPARTSYDGGDRIVAAGGAIAVTYAVWPERLRGDGGLLYEVGYGILFAGAWELYPTSAWDIEYVIPVGENLGRDGSNLRGGFTVVGFSVQAMDDDTLVDVDLDGDGSLEYSDYPLNKGKDLSIVSVARAGARVEATKPVQVHVFTGDPASTWEARGYTLIPFNQWSSDYLAPRSSDGDYWLYNPDSSALEVSVRATDIVTTITVPAAGVARYAPPPLDPSGLVSRGKTGVRFTNQDGRRFYGLVALDEDENQDWGYGLLPTANLTTQALIGWAPGNNNDPPDGDESPVYVTAVTTTTINVEYEPGRTEGFLIFPLEEQAITDTIDFDMTGSVLRSNDCVPFVPVWGQDQSAPNELPSIDVGYSIRSLRAPSIENVIQQPYCCIPADAVNWPYIVNVTLTAANAAAYDFDDVIVADTLPPEFTYMAGSTTLDGAPIPDDSGGSPFPLDEGGYLIGTVPGRGQRIVAFEATTNATGTFNNQALFIAYSAECDSPPATSASVDVVIREVGFEVDVAAPSDLLQPGEVITLAVTLTNTGQITLTELPLWETFDEDFLVFNSASVAPDVTGAGAITWVDLTQTWGPLAPNTSNDLTVSFAVNDPLPSDVSSTTSVFGSEWVGLSPGNTGPGDCICNSIGMSGPTPTHTPTPTPSITSTPTTTSTPTATIPRTETEERRTPSVTWTPRITLTGTPATAVLITPTPAVLFLPETGDNEAHSLLWWLWLALLLLGLPAAWVVRCRKG